VGLEGIGSETLRSKSPDFSRPVRATNHHLFRDTDKQAVFDNPGNLIQF
jgi:hypothetical protein